MGAKLVKKSGSLDAVKKKEHERLERSLKVAAFLCEALAKQFVPVDTGALRASIFVRQEGSLRYVVGSPLEYARYTDMGTRYMEARPWLRTAASLARRRLREMLNG